MVTRHGLRTVAVRTIAAVSVLGLTAALGGCADSDEVTLRLVAADYGHSEADSSEKYWERLTQRYESEHPGVDVQVTVHPWSEIDRKVEELVDSGMAPDMAQVGNYAEYAEEGVLHTADDVLSIPVQSDLVPQLAEAGRVDQAQYGMPFAASTRLLVYNRTLFDEAGLTPPATWEELAEAAEVLDRQGVKYPYALPLGPEEAHAEALQWLLSGGDGYVGTLGAYHLNTRQNVATLTWLKKNLVDRGLTGPVAPGKLNRAQAFGAFARGEVGMLTGHPALLKLAEKAGVRVGVAPVPGADGPSGTPLGVTDWMIAFTEEAGASGRRDEVGKFLDYVYDEHNALRLSREYGLLPTTQSAAQAAAEQEPGLKPFLDRLPHARQYPAGKRSWGMVSEDIKAGIGKALADGTAPAQVLERLQTRAMEAEATVMEE